MCEDGINILAMPTRYSHLNGTSCFSRGQKTNSEVTQLERRTCIPTQTSEIYSILSTIAGGLRLDNTVMTCSPARGLPEWLALQGPWASVESGFEGMKRLPVHRYLHWGGVGSSRKPAHVPSPRDTNMMRCFFLTPSFEAIRFHTNN